MTETAEEMTERLIGTEEEGSTEPAATPEPAATTEPATAPTTEPTAAPTAPPPPAATEPAAPTVTTEPAAATESAAAAAATLESEPEPEPQVPLGALHEAKAKLRDERAQKEALQQRITELETAEPATAPKPAAQETARPGRNIPADDPDPYDALEDDEIPTKGDQRDHEEWSARQAQREQAAVEDERREKFVTEVAAVEEQVAAEMTAEKMGKGLDYNSVVRAGQNFLTETDVAEITRQPTQQAACQKLYDLSIERCPALGIIRDLQETDKTPPVKTVPQKAAIETVTKTDQTPRPPPPASIEEAENLPAQHLAEHLMGPEEEEAA